MSPRNPAAFGWAWLAIPTLLFAAARRARAWFLTRVLTGLVCWLAIVVYLVILFLMPVVDALGNRVLFDHHAVLLPTPFL